MPIHIVSSDPAFDAAIASRRTSDPRRGRSRVRSTVVLLAVAAMGYVAGELVHDSLPAPNESVAFVRPVRAAETNSGNLPLAASLATVMGGTNELRRFNADEIEEPRECDLPKGISTACLFMD